MPTAESVTESKARLRSVIRATRRARSEGELASAAVAIAVHCRDVLGNARAVSAYLSLPTEPGTDPLLADLHAASRRVLVPRVDGRHLEWVRLRPGTELTVGPMGIREPLGPAETAHPLTGLDVVFLPGLAVDLSGIRLGQGGGYYDAALEHLPGHDRGGPLRAILLFDDEVLESVPHDKRDARVHCAVTPRGVRWFSRPA